MTVRGRAHTLSLHRSRGVVLSWFADQQFVMFMASINPADLGVLVDLMATRKVVHVIDQRYTSLAQVQDAIAYLERGRARGKVVVTLGKS